MQLAKYDSLNLDLTSAITCSMAALLPLSKHVEDKPHCITVRAVYCNYSDCMCKQSVATLSSVQTWGFLS